ncbi:MAG: hypothetical protein IKL01_08045, partial [Mailhella sp.]|nr:hypothetical protein [Mailhella sp.]
YESNDGRIGQTVEKDAHGCLLSRGTPISILAGALMPAAVIRTNSFPPPAPCRTSFLHEE